MACRGIRGAAIAASNTKKEIVAVTKKLLKQMLTMNKIKAKDIAGIIFSTTKDLNAEFPAAAARQLGYIYTPLLCTNEMPVPGSAKRCVRILMHVNTNTSQEKIKHVYLGKANALRPDFNLATKGRIK